MDNFYFRKGFIMKDKTTEKRVKDASVLATSTLRKSGIWVIILGLLLSLVLLSIVDFILTILAIIPIIGTIIAIISNIFYFWNLVKIIISFFKDVIAYKRLGITVTEAGVYGRCELGGKKNKRVNFCLTYDQITAFEIVGKQIIIDTNIVGKKNQKVRYIVSFVENMDMILYTFKQQAAKVAPVVVADAEAKTETTTDAE